MPGLEDELNAKIKEGEATATDEAKREVERQAQTDGGELEQDAKNEADRLEKKL
jgi:hypothetical protein